MTLRSTCLLASVLLALACPPSASANDKTSHGHDANCDQDVKTLKGDERDKHLAECPKTSTLGSQQNKMKTCNSEAGKRDLHGDERRAFMSTCLKG